MDIIIENNLSNKKMLKSHESALNGAKCSVTNKWFRHSLIQIFCLLLIFLLPLTIKAQFSGGDGSESTPYLITMPVELAQLATFINEGNVDYTTKYYRLENNIDLSAYGAGYNGGAGWIPIGTNVPTTARFSGVFDGNNKIITGLYINNTTEFAYIGLFGYALNSAVIKNVGIQDAVVISNRTAATWTGGLIAFINNVTISNCWFSGSIEATGTGTSYAGGLIGQNNNGSVTDSWMTGSMEAASAATIHAGGIAGRSQASVTSKCWFDGSISTNAGSTVYAGGITGSLASNANLSNCYSAGSITGTNASYVYVGGISAINWSAVLQNCYSTAFVKALTYSSSGYSAYVGGITGEFSDGTLSNNAALNASVYGEPTSPAYIGRITGNYETGLLENNIALSNMCKMPTLTQWDYIGTNLKDGDDISLADILADGTLDGKFTSPNWTAQNGMLPGFGAAVALPDYLSGTLLLLGIKISPPFIGLATGSSHTFATIPYGFNITGDATWSVTGGVAGTTINSSGLLTIAADETADLLTVTAISTEDVTISAIAEVAITDLFSGSGTESDPYLITSAEDLALLAELVNENQLIFKSLYYKLTTNIDMSDYGELFNDGEGWIPIGNLDNPFEGYFDGDNKTVSGLYTNNQNNLYVGLFGYLKGATVKNLGMIDVNINNAPSILAISFVGTIAGYNDGLSNITNCYSTGNVKSDTYLHSTYTGGIAGGSIGKISYCWSNATVSSVANIPFNHGTSVELNTGGIVGGTDEVNPECSITYCYFTGNVSSIGGCMSLYTGGIAGLQYGLLSDCFSTGNVYLEIVENTFPPTLNSLFSPNGRAGGIAGAGLNVQYCYSTAIVYATTYYYNSRAAGIVCDAGVNVSNNVALNPLVSSTWGMRKFAFRISQTAYGLSNNYGFNGMYNAFGNNTWNNVGSYGTDGENISILQIVADGTLMGIFTEERGWTIENGKLPGFGTTYDFYATSGVPLVAGVFVEEGRGIATGSPQPIDIIVAGFNITGEKTCMVEGTGPGTSITNDGILTIAEDENAKNIKIVATSTEDPTKSGSGYNFITGGGTGDIDDPYIIKKPGALVSIGEFIFNKQDTLQFKHYKLGADIDLSDYGENYTTKFGRGFIPISTSNESIFSGSFDGDGHIISNLYILRSSTGSMNSAYTGFFGLAGDNAVIKNLGLTNVYVRADQGGLSYRIGGLVGNSQLTGRQGIFIDNCYVTGTIMSLAESSSTYIGGIIGWSTACTNAATCPKSLVSNCWTDVNIYLEQVSGTSASYAGGIAGTSSYGDVKNCYSLGTITTISYAGQLVYSGGILGNTSTTCHLENCWSAATISATSNTEARAGGISSSSGVTDSQIANNVALNPSIFSQGETLSRFGRVTSYTTGLLDNNYAFEDMINPAGGTTWDNIGADQLDGVSLSKTTILSDGTLGGLFTEIDGWTTEDGKLPGFGAPVDMPVHLLIPSGSYTVSGKVTDNETFENIAGVEVALSGYANYSVFTDASGDYSFDNVLGGDGFVYTIKAEKYEYMSNQGTIEVTTNMSHNIILNKIPLFTISGFVEGTDNAAGLEGVSITITGYGDFSATTDVSGNYSIADVYDGFTYSVTAMKAGYTIYSSEITVNGNNVIHNITLTEVFFAARNVAAELSELGDNVTVTWDAPILGTATSYILDDDSPENGININPNANNWMGNIFTVEDSGLLTSIDLWGFGRDAGHEPTRKLTIEIFDESQQLIGTSDPFVIPFNDWINIPLNDIPYSGTFYVMVKWPNQPGYTNYLGFDQNGPNSSLDYSMFSADGQYIYSLYQASGGQYTGVFMVRANVLLGTKAATYSHETTPLINGVIPVPKSVTVEMFSEHDEVYDIDEDLVYKYADMIYIPDFENEISISNVNNTELNLTKIEVPESTLNNRESKQVMTKVSNSDMQTASLYKVQKSNLPVSSRSIVNTSQRAVTGYNVYRLQEGQAETNWTLIAGNIATTDFVDNDWLTLTSGAYQWAVKTVYTTGTSNARLSNVIGKEMYVDYQVNITTSTGALATGAIVTLTNQDGNPEHIYEETSDATGVVMFDEVWKGYYNIKISLNGFQTYTDTDLLISTDGLFYDAMLLELALPPESVIAEKVDNNAIITWTEPKDERWITYSTSDYKGGVGIGTAWDVTWINRFSVDKLSELNIGAGSTLTKIKFVFSSWAAAPITSGQYYLKVYQGTSSTVAGTELLEQEVSFSELVAGEYNEFELSTPIIIDPSQELWIGVRSNVSGGNPCANDNGPMILGVNMLLHQGTWYAIENIVNPPYDANWSLAGCVTSSKGEVIELSYYNDENETSKGLTGYNVYRLQPGQNEDDWTQIVTNTTTLTHTDNMSTLEWGEYQYAVKALYTAGIISEATLSNIVEHETRVNYQINIATNSGHLPTGASVTLTNLSGNPEHVYNIVSGQDGVTFNDIWKGTYNLKITLTGYEEYNAYYLDIFENGLSHTATLLDKIYQIGDVFAQTVGYEVEINWQQSIPPINDWIQWCINDNVSGTTGYSSTSGNDMTFAIRFTPQDLENLGVVSGHFITKVALGIGTHMSAVNSMEIRIWEGGTSITNPGMLNYSQQITDYTSFTENTMVEINLTTPYEIDASKELRIGWNLINELGYPFGRDAGPNVAAGKSDLFICPAINNGNWVSYFDTYNWNDNASLKAFVGDDESTIILSSAGTSPTQNEPLSVADFASMTRLTAATFEDYSEVTQNPTENDNSRGVTGYMIYRLVEGTPQSQWDLLDENVTETTYTDTNWINMTFGTFYQWAVIAKYGSGNSDAALSNPLENLIPNYEVTFNVYDISTNAQISDAVIIFNGEETGYVIQNVKPGEYEWMVIHPEYNIASGTVVVIDKDETIDVPLNSGNIEANTLANVVLYPNPFKDEIHISTSELIKSVKITNAMGQNIKDILIDKNLINTSNLNSGVYFVVIENFNGDKLVYKMVKK